MLRPTWFLTAAGEYEPSIAAICNSASRARESLRRISAYFKLRSCLPDPQLGFCSSLVLTAPRSGTASSTRANSERATRPHTARLDSVDNTSASEHACSSYYFTEGCRSARWEYIPHGGLRTWSNLSPVDRSKRCSNNHKPPTSD